VLSPLEDAARTHPCVRLFCIIDTLTSASVLPGIDAIIQEYSGRVVCNGHDPVGDMSSSPGFVVRKRRAQKARRPRGQIQLVPMIAFNAAVT
jgi:hypothetical protein